MRASAVLKDQWGASGIIQGMSRAPARRSRPDSRRWVLDGEQELIFGSLPQTVLANLTSPRSESALLWNVFYPLAARAVSLSELLALSPLWGTRVLPEPAADAGLSTYFWGFGLDGQPMPGLKRALSSVDGPGGKIEVDLFLVGGGQLIAVEAKRGAAPGRCGRYIRGRCPEILPALGRKPCRYWEPGPGEFARWLEAGARPTPATELPACSVHYQLFRTVVLAATLAGQLGLDPGLWMVIPQASWTKLEPVWLDFADRVRDEDLWRRLRVLAWEDLLSLAGGKAKRR